MSTQEIALVRDQYRARIAHILTPDELAEYDAYRARLEQASEVQTVAPVERTAPEQAVLDKIGEDQQAAALHKQLRVLLRVETLPQ